MLQFHIFLCGFKVYSVRKINKQKGVERNHVQKHYHLNTGGEQALNKQQTKIQKQNREYFSCDTFCKHVLVD